VFAALANACVKNSSKGSGWRNIGKAAENCTPVGGGDDKNNSGGGGWLSLSAHELDE